MHIKNFFPSASIGLTHPTLRRYRNSRTGATAVCSYASTPTTSPWGAPSLSTRGTWSTSAFASLPTPRRKTSHECKYKVNWRTSAHGQRTRRAFWQEALQYLKGAARRKPKRKPLSSRLTFLLQTMMTRSLCDMKKNVLALINLSLSPLPTFSRSSRPASLSFF